MDNILNEEKLNEQLEMNKSEAEEFLADQDRMEKFSQLTQDIIKHYIYCLSDPESGDPFYIGKGKGNRIFDHIIGNSEYDANVEKIAMIQEIKNKGLEVDHTIIRFGLSSEEAYEVEAALIDFIGMDDLTNRVRGHSSWRGKVTAKELEVMYGAKDIEVLDNLMVVKIKALYRSDMSDEELYEVSRKWWPVSKQNAEKVDYVLSAHNGIIRGVFKPLEWIRSPDLKRYGFEGIPAESEIKARYYHRSLKKYTKKGQANPVQYLLVDKEHSEIFELEEPIDSMEDEAVEISEKAILIKINASYREGMRKEDIYKATRGKWKLSYERANEADYVFSVVNGEIIEVFKVIKWSRCADSERIEFTGYPAQNDIRSKYIDKSVKHLYLRGEANPCKYVNI